MRRSEEAGPTAVQALGSTWRLRTLERTRVWGDVVCLVQEPQVWETASDCGGGEELASLPASFRRVVFRSCSVGANKEIFATCFSYKLNLLINSQRYCLNQAGV